MMMPIMDGPATARAMLRMNPNVRIVGASGLADSALSTKALSAGVRQLLAKPYTGGNTAPDHRARYATNRICRPTRVTSDEDQWQVWRSVSH